MRKFTIGKSGDYAKLNGSKSRDWRRNERDGLKGVVISLIALALTVAVAIGLVDKRQCEKATLPLVCSIGR